MQKSPPTSQPDLTNGTSSLRDLPNKDAPKPGPSTAANGVTGATSVPPIPQDYSSSVPYPGHHPSYTSVPPLVPPHSAVSTPTLPGQAHARSPIEQPVKPLEDGLSDAIALTCHQCSKQFSNKPLLITHQVGNLSHSVNFVLSICETLLTNIHASYVGFLSAYRVVFCCYAVNRAVISTTPRKMSSLCATTVKKKRSFMRSPASVTRTCSFAVNVR